MHSRSCLDCGRDIPITRSRCRDCQRAFDRRHHNRAYDSSAWRRASAAAVAAWVAVHGWVCPGFGVPAHPARDLSADHPEALAHGGDVVQDELGVYCLACNGRRGAGRSEPSIGLTVV